MVGGELAFGIRHKGDLLRAHFFHQGHEVVKRVALDVVFAVWPSFEQFSQIEHIAVADMALIGSRVDCEAMGTRLQTKGGSTGDAGNAQMAGVAHQRDFVQVDR